MTADYQVELPSGEPVLYYRFGGRAVAWRNDSVLRYLLADHLGSTHAEVSETQGEAGQRRYYPFGSDRAVPGAADLTREERYTGQRRVEAGGGSARRELYHYGARFYLPGVGIFTQPDTVVPEPQNPQALNRYSYVYNNPLKHVDSSGRFPIPWEALGALAQGDPFGAAYQLSGDALAALSIPKTIPGTTWGNPLYVAPVRTVDNSVPTSADTATPWLIDQMRNNAASPTTKGIAKGIGSGEAPSRAAAVRTWTGLVRGGGQWDFKPELQPRFPQITLGGRQMNYQAAANIHYGFVGRAAGFSSLDLQIGAGIAQMRDTPQFTGGPSTFGDDPFDNWNIGFGSFLYDVYGNKPDQLTPEAFERMMAWYIWLRGQPPEPLDKGY